MMTILKRKRILVVDDLLHWRKLLFELLAEYDVQVIATYEDAVRAINELEFDVVVLDIRLEDEDTWNVDGVDLLKQIKTKYPSTGIVILTGYRESAREKILRDYKPDDIIDKDAFDNATFRETIRRLIVE